MITKKSKEFLKKSKKLKRMLIGCSKWYSNKPDLADMRARIIICSEMTNHSQYLDTGFCLCTHAMY